MVRFSRKKSEALPPADGSMVGLLAKASAFLTPLADLGYVENTVYYNNNQLKKIGWGRRAANTSLEEPEHARTLEAPREGEGCGFLDRKEPVVGGAGAAYKIQRRLRPNAPWSDAGMAIESEITLANQERGKEWEYRVLAVNKAGEGEPRHRDGGALGHG